MRCPKELTGEAKEFFKSNSPSLIADGLLSEATLTGFILLCEIWQAYRDGVANKIHANGIVALSKQVQNLMASYGMTPASRKKLNIEKSATLDDVLNKMGFNP